MSYGMNNMRGDMFMQQLITIQGQYDIDGLKARERASQTKNGASSENVFHRSKFTKESAISEIQKDELVFVNNTRNRFAASNGISARTIPVLSNLNGSYARLPFKEARFAANEHTDENITLEHIAETIDFVGIAITAANSVASNLTGNRPINGLTIQLAGTHSILNTGRSNILAGDQIAWRIPSEHAVRERGEILGVHPDKVLLETIPYRLMTEGFIENFAKAKFGDDMNGSKQMKEFIDSMYKFINVIYKLSSNTNKEKIKEIITEASNETIDKIKEDNVLIKNFSTDNFRDMILPMLRPFIELQMEFDRRTIGRAVSSCKKGEKFDIYLNK